MDRDRLGGSSLQHPVMWYLGRVRGHTLDLDGGLEAGRTGSLSSLAEWVMVITKRRSVSCATSQLAICPYVLSSILASGSLFLVHEQPSHFSVPEGPRDSPVVNVVTLPLGDSYPGVQLSWEISTLLMYI